MFQGAQNLPGVLKIPTSEVWSAFSNLRYENIPEREPGKALKVYDNTTTADCKYFDLWDAACYCFDLSQKKRIIRVCADYLSGLSVEKFRRTV
jgi:hypothetical protein